MTYYFVIDDNFCVYGITAFESHNFCFGGWDCHIMFSGYLTKVVDSSLKVVCSICYLWLPFHYG